MLIEHMTHASEAASGATSEVQERLSRAVAELKAQLSHVADSQSRGVGQLKAEVANTQSKMEDSVRQQLATGKVAFDTQHEQATVELLASLASVRIRARPPLPTDGLSLSLGLVDLAWTRVFASALLQIVARRAALR